jgi:polyisoprenoid-binding protein YceI
LRPTNLLVGAITCAALLTGCGSAAATPTSLPTKPAAAATSAPAATTATATSAPAATTAPATSAPAATTAPATAPATTVPAATKPAAAATKPAAGATGGASPAAAGVAKPAGAGAQTWKVAPDRTQVTLKVNERLADRPTNNDAVLNTKAITGQIVLAPDGKVQDGSKLTVDLSTLQSDSRMRDRFIKDNTLDVGRFPNAEFTPTELRGLPSPLPTSGEFTGQLVGTMKIRETTKPITFDLTGRIEGNTVSGTATSQLKITEFGVSLPRVPAVLSMEDLARLEIAYTATT